MNNYELETLMEDLKNLIQAAKELKQIQKVMKQATVGTPCEHRNARLAYLLAVIGERATGISQMGMNEDDEGILNIVNEINSAKHTRLTFPA